MGLVAERERRSNFIGAMMYHEEVMLMSTVRNDVQRLLLNTLPEPIVREVASGQVRSRDRLPLVRYKGGATGGATVGAIGALQGRDRDVTGSLRPCAPCRVLQTRRAHPLRPQIEIAHRYDDVTVVQADMVGFTPLSASHSASEVLGILGELFDQFDVLATRYGVHKVRSCLPATLASSVGGACPSRHISLSHRTPHAMPSLAPVKVKTIGDAYVACCGAFSEEKNVTEAAARAVRFGLAMQEKVVEVAAQRGVDIGARIGVHTGMVMGGIIGTVRFHFDMWGNGVIGAMKMEELGTKNKARHARRRAAAAAR